MAFGEHKLGFTLFGLALVGLSATGIILGWLGPGGIILWVLLGIYGLVVYVFLLGHFLLIELICDLAKAVLRVGHREDSPEADDDGLC